MLNKLKTQREGFTIIEVIIVLVIGAVIMLAVFLVVPQLQRSSRDSRRQDTARRIITAAQQYASSNNGSITTPRAADAAALLSITGPIRDPQGTSDLGANNITVGTSTAVSTTPGNITVAANRGCSGNTFTSDAVNGAIAVVIKLESGTYCVSSQ